MSTVLERDLVKRNDVTVKVDAEVARLAKIVSEFEGKSLAAYVSDVLRPIVERDLEKHTRKYLESKEPDKKGGRPKH